MASQSQSLQVKICLLHLSSQHIFPVPASEAITKDCEARPGLKAFGLKSSWAHQIAWFDFIRRALSHWAHK
jgi:hypothetical protein